MSYHPRFETADATCFITTRCRNQELWFVGSPALEHALLGYLARVKERYRFSLYAFAMEGSHCHINAHFPELNRSNCMRDFNAYTANAVPRHLPKQYTGGKLWQRRFSSEIVPFEDAEKQFFYTVLQPVRDGLVRRISDWPHYNCYYDATRGIKRKFKIVRWGEYNSAKRRNPNVRRMDYTDIIELEYERLPGKEHLSREEYIKYMDAQLETKRLECIAAREKEGFTSFMPLELLLAVQPGQRAKNPKVSHSRKDKRPRVLSECAERWSYWTDWYFKKYWAYKEASELYRSGELEVNFPEGTYRPPFVHPCRAGP